jgi:hypothetical protein
MDRSAQIRVRSSVVLAVAAMVAVSGAASMLHAQAGQAPVNGQPEKPAPTSTQQGEPPEDRRPGRRPVMTREEMRQRLAQRRQELAEIQKKLDEAQKLADSPDVSDAQVSESLDALRSQLRQLIFSGISGGEGRGDWWGGGGGPGGGGVGGEGDGPDGRGRGGPRDGNPDWDKPVTEEEVAQALGWVDEHMPRLAPRLHKLAKEDPEAIKRIMQRMRPRLAEMQEMFKENPEAAKIRVAEWQAGMRVVDSIRAFRDKTKNGAPASEIASAREELKSALAEHYDAQLEVQEIDIDQLKERADRAQVKIQERRAKRDAWLAERLSEIESGKDRRGPGGGGGGGGGPDGGPKDGRPDGFDGRDGKGHGPGGPKREHRD